MQRNRYYDYNSNSAYNTQNTIYRALDTYNRPSGYTLIQCIQSIGVLLEHKDFRRVYRNYPLVEEVQELLNNLLLQARAENDEQCIREINDIRWREDLVLEGLNIALIQQNPELFRNNLPRRAKKEKFTLEAIVSDKQNVHNTAINNNVKDIVKNLCTDYPSKGNHLMNSIRIKLSTRKSWNPTNYETLEYIYKSTGTFGIGYSLKDILYSLYLWVISHKGEQRDELLQRLNEELTDMYNMWSTGHMARLVNVLQGYTTNERYILGIDIPKEIKKQIFNNLSYSLKNASESVMDGIVEKTPEYLEYINKVVQDNRTEWIEQFGEEYTEYIDKCVQGFNS
jgi:hypothetical protein